ncbi:AraC family transcriptional regulator [Mesorhizobium marinum]|uniref:AraC family transcriptional regulator n=1 Tax=Mesorhizobium marinum TaxID=3228790 RepID=UPI003465522A
MHRSPLPPGPDNLKYRSVKIAWNVLLVPEKCLCRACQADTVVDSPRQIFPVAQARRGRGAGSDCRKLILENLYGLLRPHYVISDTSDRGIPMETGGAIKTEAGDFSTNDPVLYEAAIRPWELNVDLRRSGLFECSIEYLKFDGIAIYRDRYRHDMRLQGMTPPHTLTIAVPISGVTDESAFWGRSVDPRCVYSTFHNEIDSVTAQNYDQFILLIDTEARQELAGIVDWFSSAKPSVSRNLQSLRAAASFFRLLLKLSRDPKVVGDAAIADRLRSDLIFALTQALFQQPNATSTVIGKRESRAIADMYDWIMSTGDLVVTVGQLCANAGIHERTLERAVRAKFDCTVQDLLRRMRIHEARRRLLYADRTETSVTEASYDLGFYDGGRFARDYKRMFGELPYQTLKGPPVRKIEPLLLL